MTITELALELGVRLEISYAWHPTERSFAWRCNMRCISFPAKRGFHRTPCGWGTSPQKALERLTSILRGRIIEVHPFSTCKDPQGEYFVPSDLAIEEIA